MPVGSEWASCHRIHCSGRGQLSSLPPSFSQTPLSSGGIEWVSTSLQKYTFVSTVLELESETTKTRRLHKVGSPLAIGLHVPTSLSTTRSWVTTFPLFSVKGSCVEMVCFPIRPLSWSLHIHVCTYTCAHTHALAGTSMFAVRLPTYSKSSFGGRGSCPLD